ncbi:hypothetical protein WH52_13650 [Tenacibaculum holothuriorum]|uniref:SPOR domain-containing protein n=1 Tax=Tenacibaculum holothuriorum TaxID=1635173 RepID=A0A1Y2P919_9FLAO|nr:SPOR domain-containing protein [Tenacibaculum holothuriorum]OSY86942.1 hypothetical protein WH52_13650 [Tenacibaculum holothuriorum]
MKNIQLLLLVFGLVFFTTTSINAQEKLTNNKSINSLIAKKREYNKRNKTGFRIQLYNGLEKRAKSLKHRFQIEFPGVYTKLSYKQPDWKIQVGNYKTRLQADRALAKIKEEFAGAIVVPM